MAQSDLVVSPPPQARAPRAAWASRSDTIPEPVPIPAAASHSESTHTARVQPFPTPPLFHSLFSARKPVHRRASEPRSRPCLCHSPFPVYAQPTEAHSVPSSCVFVVFGTPLYAMLYKSRQTWTVPLFIQPSKSLYASYVSFGYKIVHVMFSSAQVKHCLEHRKLGYKIVHVIMFLQQLSHCFTCSNLQFDV